jgi:hypothetical protein
MDSLHVCMDTTCQVLLVLLVSRPNHLAFTMHALHEDVAWAAREACRPGCRVTMCRRQSVHVGTVF